MLVLPSDHRINVRSNIMTRKSELTLLTGKLYSQCLRKGWQLTSVNTAQSSLCTPLSYSSIFRLILVLTVRVPNCNYCRQIMDLGKGGGWLHLWIKCVWIAALRDFYELSFLRIFTHGRVALPTAFTFYK